MESQQVECTWAFVPMSGAGTSVWTPIRSWIFWVKTRVRRSNSLLLKSPGLHPIPPLAPPYGMSATALFHVISWARAFTSSGSTFQEQNKEKHQHQFLSQYPLSKINPILFKRQQSKDISSDICSGKFVAYIKQLIHGTVMVKISVSNSFQHNARKGLFIY